MYRVAIIQNESEMLRSGFTNIIPKLKSIERLSQYSLEMFNVVNIEELFNGGENNLSNFDSLFISTNATSDKTVLSVIRKNKNKIGEFIRSGKGVFVSSQKKLSAHSDDIKTENGDIGITCFLPDYYEFYTVIRPRSEKDSGQGEINIFNLNDNLDSETQLILQYPQEVTVEKTTMHCMQNEFQKHFYRSHIVPLNTDAYASVFVDTSYQEENSRNLLMVNSVSQFGERVVVSTIAIDWEFHGDLLTNIIYHITEGLPHVAFIQKANVQNGDFDFLLTTAKLSKVAYEIYNNFEEIKKELHNIHSTYIFSPDWSEDDINRFVKKIGFYISKGRLSEKFYRRVYYFKQIDGILSLAQFSNFSTIDLIIDNAILWINAKFNSSMWGGSFWLTYDILFMMSEIGIDITSYIAPILCDIESHYKDGSYDGVMGATTGLLELTILFEQQKAKKDIPSYGVTAKESLNWIITNFKEQSNFDKQTAVLALDRVKSFLYKDDNLNFNIDEFSFLKNTVCESFYPDFLSIDNYTEIDLCKNILICFLCGNRERELGAFLEHLWKRQTPSGKWTSIVRTAYVLVFLLKHIDDLKKKAINDINIDTMIYNGILYLRSEYNWKNGNWDNDLLATTKSIHAIGLYNEMYNYSTQDFFNTLESESVKIYSASVVSTANESLRNLREKLNVAQNLIDELKVSKKISTSTIKTQEKQEERNIRAAKNYKTFAYITGTLLIAIILSLAINHTNVLLMLITEAGSILAIVVAFIITLFLTRIMDKNISSSQKKKS